MCTYLHTDRAVYSFRRSVPKDVRAYILTKTEKPRVEWLISLGTKDRREAERLCHLKAVWTDELIKAARTEIEAGRPPRSKLADQRAQQDWELQREIDAHASDLSAEEHFQWEKREDARRAIVQSLRPLAELDDDQRALRDLIDDAEFEPDNVRGIKEDAKLAAWTKAAAASLPEIKLLLRGSVDDGSIRSTFKKYAEASGISPATNKRWSPLISHFITFIGHDRLDKVTTADVRKWRDALLREPSKTGSHLSPRTVRESYLAALKAMLNYAVDEELIPHNPAAPVKVRGTKQVKLRSKDLTRDEVAKILGATLNNHSNLSEEHAFARRWIPWICAYTGARVNEITQLRAVDVVRYGAVWTIRITPEAGSQKSNEARIVPLHEHIVDQGFPIEATLKEGPLFYKPSLARGGSAANPQYKKVGERLALWVRQIGVDDPAVQPNHGWRHLFKTRAKNAGMEESAREAIPGHAASTEGRKYGENDIPYLAAQIALLPRFEPLSYHQAQLETDRSS